MQDFILLMHSDASSSPSYDAWASYFERLREAGRFQGGSAIGEGQCLRNAAVPGPLLSALSGYIRVMAFDLEDAKRLVQGNPVFEAGGTVEVRALPRD